MNIVIQIAVNASDNASADQLSELLSVLRENGVDGGDVVAMAGAADTSTDTAKPSRGRGRPKKDADAAGTTAVAGTSSNDAMTGSASAATPAPVTATATVSPASTGTVPATATTTDPASLRDQVKAAVKQKQSEGMSQDALVDIMKRATGVAFLKQVTDDKLQAFLDALNGNGTAAAEEDAFG